MMATVTGGWIAGFVALAILLPFWTVLFILSRRWLRNQKRNDPYSERGIALGCTILTAALIPITLLCWWWGSAFSTSHEYHAWNVKQGKVTQVSKRIVSNGDNGISERYVVRFGDEQLYGIDDTRASLIKPGDSVRLKCKRDWQWGIPREAQGWACRWAAAPNSLPNP
jgi:hypothetical protein